ncbi:MAG: MoxR family ATPase [Clostridia bacterium]|nr:MoxR family ATPase [Clostridia bacterium]
MNDPKSILFELKKAVVGKDNVLIMALLAILARGHILLEDIPGVGKTTMALAFSKALGLEYHRVQFTPDVLPSDIVGFSLYDKASGQMIYKPGAILCNLFLADELNRATSRTQSALLEAMEEGNVTVDGVTHPVPDPFVVIATQNPVGASGTQLLPDSQLDRFMVKLSLGYPRHSDELELLTRKQKGNPLDGVRCIADREGLADIRRAVDNTFVDKKILDYTIRLSNATRTHESILQGASPRASLAVVSMAKAAAWVQGRDYVIPNDVKLIYPASVTHRLILTAEAKASGITAQSIVTELLERIAAPSARS